MKDKLFDLTKEDIDRIVAEAFKAVQKRNDIANANKSKCQHCGRFVEALHWTGEGYDLEVCEVCAEAIANDAD